MNQVYLFGLAGQHNRWLATRQTVVAQNVANSNTPGYKTQDVVPFEETLETTRLSMARTAASHMQLSTDPAAEPVIDEVAASETLHSGNNVALEREFRKSGEISRSYTLNVSVMKTFNRMLLLSTKG
jgi:flagellar basal-body rod protein FlgB